MASPLAHGLIGYAIFAVADRPGDAAAKRRLGLCVGLAIGPDLDFLPGALLGQPNLYHQQFTHSLAAALLAGLAAALWCSRGTERWWRDGVAFTVAYASHLALDLCGPDVVAPHGLPLFAPFSQAHYLSTVQLLLGVRRPPAVEPGLLAWMGGLMSWYNLAALGREVVLFAPVALGAAYVRRRAAAAAVAGSDALAPPGRPS